MTEYNKVVYDGQTLIDLTSDDVTESDVVAGVYFHKADGTRSMGTLNINDYVVEQGTDNSWEYRKWNSGKYDATQTYATNLSVQNAWGNWYRSAYINVSLPSFQTSGYTISASVNGVDLVTFQTFGTDYVSFCQVYPASRAAASRNVKFILHGHWK